MNITTVKRFFRKNEIKGTENFYCFVKRKKFIVFVPLKFTDKVAEAMSGAGAGVIGNYDKCSFRSEGTGTFRPLKNSEPYTGKKNVLSFEKEIRLEMECDAGDVLRVTEALISSHPYQEVAYEIYDFNKRGKDVYGRLITLREKVAHSELLRMINPDIKEITINDVYFDRIILTDKDPDETIIDSGKFVNADCIISAAEKKIKLIIL